MVEETLIFEPIDVVLEDFELIPYVRMTKRTMHIDKYAKRYLSMFTAGRARLLESLEKSTYPKYGEFYIPEKTPFLACIYVFTNLRLHRCDMDNLVKSALDMSQSVIFPNDNQIDAIVSSRHPAEGRPPMLRMIYSPWIGW